MDGIPLANVVRVDVITESTPPTVITMTTNNEANIDPVINEGGKTTLRVKNEIIAQNNFEDLVTGYTTKLKDVTLRPEQLALVDGGTFTLKDHGAAKVFSYKGPKMGVVLARIKATVDIWTEEKDADGSTMSYVRSRVQHAQGKPVSFSFKDGEFFAPEYNLESRPKLKEEPVSFDQFLALPDEDLTAQELLDLSNDPVNPIDPPEDP